MIVEVLNTGSELLLGEVVNTHAAWFGKQLFPMGLRISRQTTVPDGAPIRQAFLEAFPRADVLLVTGGLGPTTDDVTREIAAELLARRLEPNDIVRHHIEARLAARGIPLRERMMRQIMVPAGATVLENRNGTAPGLYLPATESPSSSTPHLFLLPGPPRELHPMFLESVVPILQKLCEGLSAQDCRVYRVVGMGESEVEEMIGLELSKDPRWEIGYCARPNEVDFRIVGTAADLDALEPRIRDVLGKFLVTTEGESLEAWVVNHLIKIGATVTAAESCTGGLLLNRLTNVPGASRVLNEGFVTYANEVKVATLGVDAELIAAEGAVSAPVAKAMAEGARKKANADYAVSLTGIAGPDGGSEEKPVGLVFIGLATRNTEPQAREFRFPSDRETFKQLSTQAALDMLRRELLR
ncbi:MAG: competence/damage-inducible protein A [Terrimicrobiaceae bacterium]